MILKRVFFYRVKGNIDVIRLVKKSDYQSRLFWQGTRFGFDLFGVQSLLFRNFGTFQFHHDFHSFALLFRSNFDQQQSFYLH